MKKSFILLTLIFFTNSFSANSQITFRDYFSSSQIRDVVQNHDSTFTAVGCRNFSHGILVKFNSSGDTLWTRLFNDGNNFVLQSVYECSDYGYITGGTTKISPDGFRTFLIRTDSNGDTLWTRKYSCAGPLWITRVMETQDHGFIVAGNSDSLHAHKYNFILFKTDSIGIPLWSRTYENPLGTSAKNLNKTSDGGFVITGGVILQNGYKYGLLRLNQFGDTLWTRCYGDTIYSNSSEICNAVIETQDHGFALAGISSMNFQDLFLVVTDSLGNLRWSENYGSNGSEVGNNILQNSNGDFTMVGYTDGFGHPSTAGYAVSVDSMGAVLWSKVYNYNNTGNLTKVVKAFDGGYIFSSFSGEIIKSNSSGFSGCSDSSVNTIATIPTTVAFNIPYHVIIPSIYLYPTNISITRGLSIIDPCNFETGINQLEKIMSPFIFPNPTNGLLNIKVPGNSERVHIDIYNSSGMKVFSSDVNENEFHINLEKLTPGVYCLTLSDGISIWNKMFEVGY